MTLFSKIVTTSLVSLLLTITTVNAQGAPQLLSEKQWSYDTDPYGSSAIIKDKLITTDGVWINFTRIPRVDVMRNSWIEVIYQLANASLENTKKISLTYKCDIELLIKLSQQDYGKEGDESYAHYQVTLPPATEWTTKEVALSNFSRPHWTPASSKDFGLIPERIDALYFTPQMTDEKGGNATLQIRSVELL